MHSVADIDNYSPIHPIMRLLQDGSLKGSKFVQLWLRSYFWELTKGMFNHGIAGPIAAWLVQERGMKMEGMQFLATPSSRLQK